MHIRSIEDACGALWHTADSSPGGAMMAMGVWSEKRPARGEDAEPLFVHSRQTSRGILAVFDGAGGAGSAIEGSSDGTVDRTGAWVGSRVARATTEEWFVLTERRGEPRDAVGLRGALATRLGEMHTRRRRKIGGTMRRELPTTLAALEYRRDAGTLSWRAMWAGDSRCYALSADGGLQQLSKDDTEAQDALVLLNSDPPMTNMIAADGKFRINQHDGELAEPSVLLAATDGFFGYVNTPADFEHLLLDTMRGAADLPDWGQRLLSEVSAYTGDDASLVLVAVGFDNFPQLRARFRDRADLMTRDHAEPMRDALDKGRDAVVTAREDSWSRYRGSYEERMPTHDDRETRA